MLETQHRHNMESVLDMNLQGVHTLKLEEFILQTITQILIRFLYMVRMVEEKVGLFHHINFLTFTQDINLRFLVITS